MMTFSESRCKTNDLNSNLESKGNSVVGVA